MIIDMAVISKELNQLGYITSLVHDNDSSILLFYKDSSEVAIIFGIAQLKVLGDISIGNIMIIHDERPILTFNSILKENSYSYNALLETIKTIEYGINKNYDEDYISKEMLLNEKFKYPDEIIQRFISANNYTPERKKYE